MTEYPFITTGLGELTPDLWARLMDMLRFFEASGAGNNIGGAAAGSAQPGEFAPRFTNTFFAKIIGSTELSGGAGAGADRYAYQFAEVYPAMTFVNEEDDDITDFTFTTRENGITGKAVNLAETTNTRTQFGPFAYEKCGCEAEGSGSCDFLTPVQPNEIVLMRSCPEASGRPAYFFTAPMYPGTVCEVQLVNKVEYSTSDGKLTMDVIKTSIMGKMEDAADGTERGVEELITQAVECDET